MMDYTKIPDGAEKQEIDLYLSDFLKNKEKIIEKNNIIYALEQLGRIAEEYTCYKLDADSLLSEFLIENIDFNNEELIDLISFITIKMSLTKVINYMKENRKQTSKEIKKIIKKTEREMYHKEYLEELNITTTELLSEMKKSKLKGTYTILDNGLIEWKIQENVRIKIFLEGSSGCDDVLNFYYKDPNGIEYRTIWADEYPHKEIMKLLIKYNNSKFEIKEKGLFRKKYKLYNNFKKR